MKILLFTFLAALCCMAMNAQTAFEVDGIKYSVTGENTVEVVKKDPSYSGTVVIPSTVTYSNTTYNVTAIGDHAFYECSGLTYVSLPESLKSIGSLAFDCCYKIFGLKVPDGVTSIGNNAFCYIRNVIFNGNATDELNNNWGASALNGYVEGDLVYDSPLKKKFCAVSCSFTGRLVIPEGVEEIGSRAIYDCSVSSVVIPSTVTKVEPSIISNASNLKNIYFLPITPPTYGGDWAIRNLTLLEHIYVLNDDAYKKWTALSDDYINKVTLCPLDVLKGLYKDILTDKKNTSNLTDEEETAVDGYITRIGEATEILGALKIYTEAIIYILKNDADYLTEDDVTTINTQIAAIQSATDMGSVATAESAAINVINKRQEKQTAIAELKAYIADMKIANAPMKDYTDSINAATTSDKITDIVTAIKTEIDNYKIFTLGDWKYLLDDNDGEYAIVGGSLTFTDKDFYQSGNDFTVTGKLEYTRTFKATGVWQAWFVPFDVPVSDMNDAGMEVAEIAGVLMDENKQPYIAFAKMTDRKAIVNANTPYVVKTTKSSVSMTLTGPDICIRKSTSAELEAKRLTVQSSYNTFTFGGNYQQTNGYANKWYALNTSGVFQKMGDGANLEPQRFWMKIDTRTDTPYHTGSSATAKAFIGMTVLGDDDTTGIESLTPSLSKGKGTIYNLQGQKVTSIRKGQVYIVDGKRFMAR